MERLKGETGVSPVLSRNCDFGKISRISQAARPAGVHHTLAERRWGTLDWQHRKLRSLPSLPATGREISLC